MNSDAQSIERSARIAIAAAEREKADRAAVAITRTFSRRIQIHREDIENIRGSMRSIMVISVIKDGRHARGVVRSLAEDDIVTCVRSACGIARFTDPDPWIDLPDPDLHPREFPDLGIWYPFIHDVDMERDLLLSIAADAQRDGQGKEMLTSFGLDSSDCHSVLATSAGFCGHESASMYTGFSEWLVRSGTDAQKFSDSLSKRSPPERNDYQALIEHTAVKANAMLGARRIATGAYRVALSSMAASFLFHAVVNAFLGSVHLRRLSFLHGRLGERVFPPGFDLVDDARLYGGLGSSNFDNEGVATARTVMVEDGRISAWLLSSYAARRLGMRATGHASGVYNVRAEGGADETELPGILENGLLVQRFHGAIPNALTGQFSLGASGWWVENGQIKHAVQGVAVAGDLRRLLPALRLVGRCPIQRPKISIGAVLLPELMIGGS